MLAHFAHHILTALPTPLAPFFRAEFNLTNASTMLVQSVFAWSYGLAQIPAGWLADRIGTRILLIVGICGLAFGGVLIGLSQTYAMLLAFMVIMGILGGGYHPSAAPMVSASVAPEYRGRALGFHEIGAGTSFLVAPMAAAGIATVWGWRAAYIGLAVPVLVFGICVAIHLRRGVRAKGGATDVTGGFGETAPPKGNTLRLIVFLALSIFTGGMIHSVTSLAPLFIIDNYGVSEFTASVFFTVFASAGVWASPVGGHLSDRIGRVPMIIALCLITGVGIYLVTVAPFWLALALVMLLLGIATFMRMPVSEAYIIGETTERNRSFVYGFYYSTMTGTGAIFAPILGHFSDIYGYESIFTGSAVAVVGLTVVCGLFLRGSRN